MTTTFLLPIGGRFGEDIRGKIELAPGLTLDSLSEPEAEWMRETVEIHHPYRPGWIVAGTRCIRIQDDNFGELQWAPPSPSLQPTGARAAFPHTRACNVLCAMSLDRPVFFNILGQYWFRSETGDIEDRTTGGANGDWWQSSLLLWGAEKGDQFPVFDRAAFDHIRPRIATIELAQGLGSNRIAQCVRYASRALFDQEWDACFLQLWQAIEAILGFNDAEATHQLCESAACMLAPFGPKRRQCYDDLRRLYGVRSKLVHGALDPDAIQKLGQSAHNDLERLSRATKGVLDTVLSDARALDVFSSTAKGATQSQRNFLRDRLLGDGSPG